MVRLHVQLVVKKVSMVLRAAAAQRLTLLGVRDIQVELLTILISIVVLGQLEVIKASLCFVVRCSAHVFVGLLLRTSEAVWESI